MAIRSPSPPDRSVQALVVGLGALAESASTEGPGFEPQVFGAAGASRRALRFHSAQAGDLAAGQPLWECARYIGWRYLLPGIAGAQAAEVVDERGVHAMRVHNESDINLETWRLLDTLKGRPELEGGDYEPKYLTIPALSVVALWLDTVLAMSGFVIAVPEWETRFERNRLIPMLEFDGLVRPLAIARTSAPDSI